MSSRNARFATAVIAAALLVAGCGGGGGGGGGGGESSGGASTGTPSTNAPAGTVTITPKGPVTATTNAGEPLSAVLEGTWQANNLASGAAVYLKVADLADMFRMPAVQPAPAGGTFRYELSPKAEPVAGLHSGQLEVTACRDAGCVQTYGAPVRIEYRIDIASLGEWETLARDASHASYVPARIDPSRLKQAWEWTVPAVPDAVETFVTRPTTIEGALVLVSGGTLVDGNQRGVAMRQFSEATGAQRWAVPISDDARGTAPGSNGHIAYLPTLGANDVILAYDGNTGEEAFRYSMQTHPRASTLAPSHYKGTIYFFAGYGGDELHAADATTGARLWSKPRLGQQSATPTVDEEHVYYHAVSGGFTTIEVLDRRTGDRLASILDPSSDGTQPTGSNIVALGSRGNLISRSFRALNATRLSSFNIAQRQWEWTTAYPYSQFYAVADGVIYALRAISGTPTLDAIDETNGQVLWSWSAPFTDNQSSPYGNLVVTRGMVFFGTQSAGGADSWVWAVDTAQRKLAWREPDAGYIIISGSRTVYLLSGPPGGIINRIRALRMQ